MPTIVVVPAEKGKFKVLVNYVQQGVEYSSKELAQTQANKIAEKIRHTIRVK